MKRIIVIISVLLVSTGFVVSKINSESGENAALSTTIQGDTTQTDTAQTERKGYAVPQTKVNDQEEEVAPEDTAAKSNILLSSSRKQDFSFLTILRGLLGMAALIIIAWLFSVNRKGINWSVVGKGLLIQVVLALCILYIPAVATVFDFVGKIFVKILDFTKAGSDFLFGPLMNTDSIGYIFAFKILPTIIFFSALTSVLFYFGVIQVVVKGLAWLMTKAMKLSGMESLSVAGNIFIGQTESPLMIKEYLPKMNDSEMLLVMIGGMATVAGGVLAAYIGFLGGDDPSQRVLFAKHLLTASVMAAPGAIVISKVLMPQTEKP